MDALRDWGHAKDYVRMQWMMLQQDCPDDYVICTGGTHTIREFLTIAFKEIGIDDWSDYVVQDPEFYRPAEVDYLRGDCSKANKKLGWTPRHSFEDLVKILPKVINQKGIINIGGKSQSIYSFAKFQDKTIKKIKAKKNSLMPLNQTMNLNKLKKVLKKSK